MFALVVRFYLRDEEAARGLRQSSRGDQPRRSGKASQVRLSMRYIR